MDLKTLYYDEVPHERRAVDIAVPAKLAYDVALFYVHGGGWEAGERAAFHSHLEHFAKRGYLCASTGYRLAPEVQLADQMADIVLGYQLFCDELKALYGEAIKRVIVIGSSAGAHLATLLAMTEASEWYIEHEITVNEHWMKPAACVSINGPGTMELWEPMEETIQKCIEQVMRAKYGEAEELFRQISPLARVGADSSDFLFLIVGKEQYFPHSYVYELSEQLQQFGKYSEVVLFPEAEHGFFYGVDSGLQQEALVVLQSFISRYE